MKQLDYTFEECLNQMILIKIVEDNSYKHTLYFTVKNINDYNELVEIIDDYEKQDQLDEYFVYM
jgi:DNA polymerase II large subunit